MPTLHLADYDGFYGEPAPFDPTLEVELELAAVAASIVADDAALADDPVTAPIALPLVAEVVALRPDHLDDEWFGSFDETAEFPVSEFEDIPTSPWQKLGGWLRSLGRAA